MSMFRSLWNTLKSREASRSRNLSRNRDAPRSRNRNRDAARVQSATHCDMETISHIREISSVRSDSCDNENSLLTSEITTTDTSAITSAVTLADAPAVTTADTAADAPAVETPRKSSNVKTDSLLTFFRRKNTLGIDSTLDQPRNSKSENSVCSNGEILNNLDTFSDMLTYLREDPSSTISTALHIENYTTFASDLKEKIEESTKSENSLMSRQEEKHESKNHADKYKTITIRTLSKSIRDALINELIDDAENIAELQNEVQIHDTSLDQLP